MPEVRRADEASITRSQRLIATCLPTMAAPFTAHRWISRPRARKTWWQWPKRMRKRFSNGVANPPFGSPAFYSGRLAAWFSGEMAEWPPKPPRLSTRLPTAHPTQTPSVWRWTFDTRARQRPILSTMNSKCISKTSLKMSRWRWRDSSNAPPSRKMLFAPPVARCYGLPANL